MKMHKMGPPNHGGKFGVEKEKEKVEVEKVEKVKKGDAEKLNENTNKNEMN